MLIDEYRFSLIWNETVIGGLTGTLPLARIALPAAISRPRYQAHFDAVQAARTGGEDVAPPWPPHGRQGFWEQYLENKQPLARVTGTQAWKSAVPLRRVPALDLSGSDASVRIVSEGLLHPWGVTLMVTVYSRSVAATLQQLADRLISQRRQDAWRLAGHSLRLDHVASTGLDLLREGVFGGAPAGQRTSEPFSVFTVVRADVASADSDPAANPAVARLLHAATSFSGTWRADALPDLKTMEVAGLSHKPASHIIYGTRRARAVWGPEHFSTPGDHALGCQHRNLVLASAQIEALSAFARATNAMPSRLTLEHESVARRAMIMLGRMYLGASTSFRSKSVLNQVAADGSLPEINALRKRLKLDALS